MTFRAQLRPGAVPEFGHAAETPEPISGRIVIADDLAPVREALSVLLTDDGHQVTAASDGRAALEAVRVQAPDLVLLDVEMPYLTGVEVCRQVKADPATRLVPVILLTGIADRSARLQGISAGADDFLEKPVQAAELRARVNVLVRMKRFTDELDSAESILLTLATTIEARDQCTSGHCERMASYASRLGRHIGLPVDDITALSRGGYLHDLGKIAIPDSILLKPAALSTQEAEAMREHAAIGEALCGSLRQLRLVRPIVRHHHERLDGSGYPDGLKGAAIPLLAQVMAVVDVYDALTSDRPYRAALTADQAFEVLDDEVRCGWRDRELVAEFATMCRQPLNAAAFNHPAAT
jgi:putative two-component system response regulator